MNIKRNVQDILKKLVEDKRNGVGRRKCPTHSGDTKEFCYYWNDEEFTEAEPIYNPVIALLLVMVGEHLKSVIPSKFSDYIHEANVALDRNKGHKNWASKIISSPFPYEYQDASSEDSDL